MEPWYTTGTKNTMLGAVTVNLLSLHTVEPDPGNPAASEYGGDGYQRQDCSVAAADDGKRKLEQPVVFAGQPSDEVSWVGYWTSGTFRGAARLTDAPAAFDATTGLLVLLADETLYGIGDCGA